jgi:murein DD-endopeptidase MepM/ murein hydrolase activator NlpD
MPIPFDPSSRAETSPIPGDTRAEARAPERLQAAALVQQFEGLLLTEMLRDLDMAGDEDEASFGLGGATLADTMRGELGLALSRAGGLGLGDVLARAFARQQGVGSVDDTAPVAPASPGLPLAPSPVPGPPAAAPASAADSSAERAPVSSRYGWRPDPFTGQARFHAGTDLRLAYGSPVAALAPGTVSFAGERGGYGLAVVVDHGDGRETLFAHLSAIDVRVGDRVDAGQTIARSGNSGRATGAHLHVEVREGGRAVDPRDSSLPLSGMGENGSW